MGLTPVTYKEEWTVVVGKDRFILNEKQIKVLKDATMEGIKGVIWFGDNAISVPHVQSVFLNWRKRDQRLLEAGSERAFTQEEVAKRLKKNQLIKEKLRKS